MSADVTDNTRSHNVVNSQLIKVCYTVQMTADTVDKPSNITSYIQSMVIFTESSQGECGGPL